MTAGNVNAMNHDPNKPAGGCQPAGQLGWLGPCHQKKLVPKPELGNEGEKSGGSVVFALVAKPASTGPGPVGQLA